MKNLLIALAAVLVMGTATNPAYALPDEFCIVFAESAGLKMEARQVGVDIVAVLAIDTSDNPNMKKLNRKVTLDAYEQPRMRVKKNQRRAIEEFRTKWFLICNKL